MRDWVGMIRRGLRKPPRVIVRRIADELRAQLERRMAPRRGRLRLARLLAELEASDLDSLWRELATLPYPAVTTPVDRATFEALCPGETARVLARAEDALAHRVDMLGSGPVELGEDIDWLVDFRSGVRWPPAYFSDIDVSGAAKGGDVKVPWELSRLQWLIPLGQAFLLNGDDRYAEEARRVVLHWIEHNPYAHTVNWASTMEVALRVLTLTWLFHVFHAHRAWSDVGFRERFLCSLYLHVDFIQRHVIRSEVNAGVYAVSAAGLVFGGLFFGRGGRAQGWQQRGWEMLSAEIPLQVNPDGTEFEGSVSYHRLSMEFFLLPALYRLCHGLPVDALYRQRLLDMARYIAAYTKPDGLAPLWGDDGGTRALPFDRRDINDHRFMIGLAGAGLGDAAVSALFGGPRAEVFWVLGATRAAALPPAPVTLLSQAFTNGGYFVMRSGSDHVFIDCAPVGLAGRGGHGHNDCLSFEAVLDGVPLVSDRGTFTYTASYTERNRFRSTASHNTPCVDGEEINRFIDPAWLWSLHYDARPELVRWGVEQDHALFVGRHSGYQRLPEPVLPERTLLALFDCHALYLADQFIGTGVHEISEPLQLTPGVTVVNAGVDRVYLRVGDREFLLRWSASAGFSLCIEDSPVSPAYGVSVPAVRLRWVRRGALPASFAWLLAPANGNGRAESSLRDHLGRYGLDLGL